MNQHNYQPDNCDNYVAMVIWTHSMRPFTNQSLPEQKQAMETGRFLNLNPTMMMHESDGTKQSTSKEEIRHRACRVIARCAW